MADTVGCAMDTWSSCGEHCVCYWAISEISNVTWRSLVIPEDWTDAKHQTGGMTYLPFCFLLPLLAKIY